MSEEEKPPEVKLDADVMRVILNTVRDVQGTKSYNEGRSAGRKEERNLIRSKMFTVQKDAAAKGDTKAVDVLEDVILWLRYRTSKMENQ